MHVLGRKLFLGCILFTLVVNVLAQSNDDILDQLTDEFYEEVDEDLSTREVILDGLFQVKTNHHFLYSGLTMSNTTSYAGREYYAGVGSSLPQLFYMNTKGWMFGVGMVKYGSTFPVNNSYVLSGGYSFSMGKNDQTRMRLAYTRGTSINSDEGHEVSSSNTLSTSISFPKSGIISSRFGYSYMMSEYNSHQFSADFYKRIHLKKWKNGNSLEITPDLNFYFSDHEYLADVFIVSETRFETIYDYNYSSTFGLLSASLSIPVEFNAGDFDFTLEYTHHMPRRFSDYEEFSVSPMLSFSIGYFLFLK